MNRVARSGLLLVIAALALGFLSSCRREAPSNVDRNKPPETYINRAPAESSLAYYKVHFYWSGSDPDGQIAYFELAVTDSNEIPGQRLTEGSGYTRTTKTDSVFTLKAEPPIEQQILGHRLYVRAVDNEGKTDPTPAVAYFVAKNDYYPQVTFNPGYGRWVDKFGNTLIRAFKGGAPGTVPDTVGVGAFVHWGWGGSDQDPGGAVTGYSYKLASQPSYRRVSAADTVAEFTFPMNAARRQVLQVRAIDDGGLRSLDDYSYTTILNFDPITLIVHPTDRNPDNTPKHDLVFFDPGVPGIFKSGTTLADKTHQILVSFTGYDDPRDYKANPNDPGISGYQLRHLFRDDSFGSPGGEAFFRVDGLPYPTVNQTALNTLGSGDHFILIRSIDDLLVSDSTPDTVMVKINYHPYVTRLWVRPESAPADQNVSLIDLAPDDASTVIRLAEGERLLVTVLGRDVHFTNPDPNTPAGLDALKYDTNRTEGSGVVEQEQSQLAPNEAYRAFLASDATEPGFDPVPDHNNLEIPYTNLLTISQPGTYTIRADVKDQTFTNPTTGRIGGVVRRVQIVR